ncbi:hypothetical protein [Comamonas sp. F1-6]|uniref:hypothetical protein n=1 Tax=Comamonas sp. F1-6 TaxID=673550 RepID=UPI0031DE05A0
MCTGLEFLATAASTASSAAAAVGGWGTVAGAAGTLFSGISQYQARSDAAVAAGQQAGYTAATADQQADLIRRQGRREVGAARAAIAGNNTALDEFSLINTREIARAAEQDAQMTILSGGRESDSLAQQAKGYAKSAGNSLAGSLLSAGGQAYTGWKGTQQVTLPGNDAASQFYFNGTRGMGD